MDDALRCKSSNCASTACTSAAEKSDNGFAHSRSANCKSRRYDPTAASASPASSHIASQKRSITTNPR